MNSINISVSPTISPAIMVFLAALISALVQFGLHYYYHPNQGRQLTRLKAFVAGSLGWVIPLLVVFISQGGWFYALATIVVLGCSGGITAWVYFYDRALSNAALAEDERELREIAERLVKGSKI